MKKRESFLMSALGFAAVAAMALAPGQTVQAQVSFYTGNTQIVNSQGLLGFDDITHNGQSLVNYTDQGVIVNINNIAFIFTPCGFNNPNIYYPNTGTLARISITKQDQSDFSILEMSPSHGFAGCNVYLWATAYKDGNVVGDFDEDFQAGTLIGFNGDFDELLIGSYQDAATRDTHNEAALNAFAIDNLEYGTGQGGGYTLSLGGTCPGSVSVSWSGATPNAHQAIAFGQNQGNTTIPSGPCAGTALGLQGGVMQVGNLIGTGANGSGSVNGHAGAFACHHYLQLVEVGTCSTSNVAQIP